MTGISLPKHIECHLRADDGRPFWIRDGVPRCSSTGDLVHPECALIAIEPTTPPLPPTSLPPMPTQPGVPGLPFRVHVDEGTEAWRICRIDGRGGAAWMMDDDRRPTGRPAGRVFVEIDAQVIGAGADTPVERRIYAMSPEQVLWLVEAFAAWLTDAEAAIIELARSQS